MCFFPQPSPAIPRFAHLHETNNAVLFPHFASKTGLVSLLSCSSTPIFACHGGGEPKKASIWVCFFPQPSPAIPRFAHIHEPTMGSSRSDRFATARDLRGSNPRRPKLSTSEVDHGKVVSCPTRRRLPISLSPSHRTAPGRRRSIVSRLCEK